MQANESLTEKHTRLAHQMLDNAEREIAAGDLTQGGKTLGSNQPVPQGLLRQPRSASWQVRALSTRRA